MRRLAKLLPYAAIGIVLLIAAVYIYFIGPFQARIRETLIRELAARTGLQVKVGRVTVTTGEAVLRDLVLTEQDGTPVLSAPEVRILLGTGRFPRSVEELRQIREVQLRQPVLHMVREKSGTLDISKFLERQAKGPRFTGRIVVTDGVIEYLDQTRGGVVTKLLHMNLDYVVAKDGKATIAVQATGEKDAFTALNITGDRNPTTGATHLSGRITNLSLRYAMARIPPIPGLQIRAGQADIIGDVTIDRNAQNQTVVTPNIRLLPRGVALAVPSLTQPITGVTGELLVLSHEVRVVTLRGTLAGAVLTTSGTITDFKKPKLNLTFTTSGIELRQVQALLPTVTLPPELKITSPLTLRASIRGTPPDLAVQGRASLPSVEIACIPWHDLVADFTWNKGQLTISNLRAHGSPRKLEGNLQMQLGPGPRRTHATLTMRDVPLQMLANCVEKLKGTPVSGVATITVTAEIAQGAGLQGKFSTRNVRYQQYALGEISGEFETVGADTLRLFNARIAGPTATGAFSGTATRTGAFSVQANLRALHLDRLGFAGLTGVGSGTLRVSGTSGTERMTGQVRLELSGAPYDIRSLTADFQLTRQQITLTNLVVKPREGEITGTLTLTNWRQGKQAGLAGQLSVTNVPVQEWLPPNVAAIMPQAFATGTMTLGGRVGSPRLQADLQLNAVEVKQVGTGVGHLRITYENGNVTIDELTFQSEQGRIEVRGGYSRLRGLNLTIPEATADLSQLSLLSPYLKFLQGRLAGRATISASVQGRPERPEVAFSLHSDNARVLFPKPKAPVNPRVEAVRIKELPLRNLDIVGEMKNNLVTLKQAQFQQDGATVSLVGTFNTDTFEPSFHFSAAQVEMATVSHWLRPTTGLAITGPVTVDVTLTGDLLEPHAAFTVSAPALEVNGIPFHDMVIPGDLRGTTITLDQGRFWQDQGEFTLNGPVDYDTEEMNLALELKNVDIYNMTLVFARAAARLDFFGTTDRLIQAYAPLPGPLQGTLSTTAAITGSFTRPQAAMDITVTDLHYDGESIDSIEGNLAVTAEDGLLRELEITSLTATKGDATVSIQDGRVVTGGEINLHIDVNNFELGLLEPWIHGAKNLKGEATISADVTESTANPLLIGSVSVVDFAWGRLHLENALFYPIRIQERVLKIEDILLREGDMTGKGHAQVDLPPLGVRWTLADYLPTVQAYLSIANGSFAPIAGMTAATYNADMYVVGRKVILRGSPGVAPGPDIPGVRGTMGGGSFSVSGEITLPENPTTIASLLESTANVIANLDPLDLEYPHFFKAQLGGTLLLVNNPDTGKVEVVTPEGKPLVLSNGSIGVPPADWRPAAPALPLAPDIDVTVITGDNLRVRYPPVDTLVQHGTLHLTGALSGEAIQLHGTVESARGRLNFPNARLTLTRGLAALDREAGKLLHIRIVEAEATGEVGDYHIVLNPRGLIYPQVCDEPGCVELDLDARSTPYLDTPYIVALLVGPVISPAATSIGTDPLSVLSSASRPQAAAGVITGFTVPGLSGQNLALDYSFEGPLQLRLRERLFGRLFGQYIAPVTGPAENRRLALTYQVTPRYSIGWSVNGLDQSRWQAQAFFSF